MMLGSNAHHPMLSLTKGVQNMSQTLICSVGIWQDVENVKELCQRHGERL